MEAAAFLGFFAQKTTANSAATLPANSWRSRNAQNFGKRNDDNANKDFKVHNYT